MWYSIIGLICLYLGFRVGLNTDMSISTRNQLDFLEDKVSIANEERDKALDLAKSWERRYNYLVSIQENKNEYDAV
jgi:hypothetical protein